MFKRLILSFIAMVSLAGTLTAGIVNGQASLVIGQPDFVSSGAALTASSLNSPNGVAIDRVNDILYVSDTINNRILFWNNASTSLSNGKAADGVIGQADFTTTASGATAATLNNPYGICIDTSSNLWVADEGNGRVLMFPYPQVTQGPSPSAVKVIGQPNLTSYNTSVPPSPTSMSLNQPYAVNVDTAGRIFVADKGNNRTLVYIAPISTGSQQAVIFLGQTGSTSNGSGVTLNTQNAPYGVYASSYSAGHIFVADTSNNRALVYLNPPGTNESAVYVLGQINGTAGSPNQGGSPTANTLSSPYSITSSKYGTQIWVADKGNNRVLMYNEPIASPYNAPASFFIGQTGFTPSAPACSQEGLSGPACVFGDSSNNLWVVDTGNNRVLRYDDFTISSITCGGSPNRLVQGLSAETVAITGTGLPQGCTVQLSRAGQTFTGTNVSYASEQSITCMFDLSTAATGSWNLSAVFTDANSRVNTVSLAGGCTIFFQNITSVSPNDAANGSVLQAQASGEGFLTGAILSLTKQGQSPIVASAISIAAGEKQLSGTFDLTGAVTGYWNVMVSTGNVSAVLPNGFFISTSTIISRHIDPDQNSLISIQGSQYGALLFISTGVFSAPVTVSIAIPPNVTPPPVNQSELKPLNVYFDITDNLNLQPASNVLLTVFYASGLAQGLDQTKFRVCQYSAATGRWAPAPSTSYPGSDEVAATIDHFSWYGLFQMVTARNIGHVYVYPNPYRPNSNTIYSDPPLGHGIVFAGLPPKAQIKIFTITGELVKELSETTGDGTLLWDTLTADGHHTASGVYIYLVTSPEAPGSKTTGRFAIIE